MSLLALLLAAAAEAVLTVPRDASAAVRIVCAVGHTTRVVLPEPLLHLRSREAEMKALGLTVESARPQATLLLQPTEHPARGTFDFIGPGLRVTLALETAAAGEDAVWRLAVAEPTPAPAPAAAATPSPDPDRPDASELLRARILEIGRREGLPGQKPMVLVDALQGERWLWLRLRLEDGARSRVERIWWEHGELRAHLAEAEGRDLRIVVPLPRAQVSSQTRLHLKVGSGPPYRFALQPDTLGRLFRELFR